NAMLRRLLARRWRPLSDEDLQKVEAACRTFQQQLIVFTLLDLGLRVSELSELTPAMLDQEARIMRVQRTRTVGTAEERLLPMTQRTASLWRQFFTDKEQFALSTRQVQRIVQAIGKSAGFADRLSPQALRETFAVRLIEKGASPALLNYAMGYQQPAMPAEEAVAALTLLVNT
ncbi:MAG: site-specific integrase, partial [Acidobacteriaceae bacterium]|nr:site-specific integrase [Acidobacteriaceae bacterium]